MKARKILGIIIFVILGLIVIGGLLAFCIYKCILAGKSPWIAVGVVFGCIAFVAIVAGVVWLAINLIYPKH